MAITQQNVGGYVVLSPQGRLAMGGAAEEFEERAEDLIAEGFIHLVADLRAVPHLDSWGIRALMRAYTSTLRFGGTFRLVQPNATIRKVLEVTKLTGVLPIYESVEAATQPPVHRPG